MVFDSAPKFGAVLRAIETSERPSLFHCTGGRDRTGITAALLLHILGIPKETIISDYAVLLTALKCLRPAKMKGMTQMKKIVVIAILAAACLLGGDEKREVSLQGTIVEKVATIGTQEIHLRRDVITVKGKVDQNINCFLPFDERDPNFADYRKGDDLVVKGRISDTASPENDAVVGLYPCVVTKWTSKR